MTASKHAIPCHIIAGPLGVGKTSAILDYLRLHSGSQRVGVLVNDFGPLGLDSAILAAEAPQTKVLNVPGGCICCTMLSQLPEQIQRLTADGALDRLIIEPSGMAAPEQVVDLLRDSQVALAIDLRPVIVMLNVAAFDGDRFHRSGYYRAFHEAADVLVFNRCDEAGKARIGEARQWGERLDPPKLRVVMTSQGQLPPDLLELVAEQDERHDAHAHQHHHHHHDDDVFAGGFVLPADEVFSEEQLVVNLMRLCHFGVGDVQVLRLKGIFHTHAGWQTIEIASNAVSFRPSSHRRDNRLEWITRLGTLDQQCVLRQLTRPLDWQEMAQAMNTD